MAIDKTNTTQQNVVATANRDNTDIEDSAKANEDPFWSYAELSTEKRRWNKVYPYRLCLWTRNEDGRWEQDYSVLQPFTLPIAPESLTISTPFAINTSVTLGGIVEEHNGAPLRTISISGTTGVLPLRGRAEGTAANRSSTGTLNAVFAGTLRGASQVKTAITGTGIGATKNTLAAEESESSSGYAQFKLLQRFLEAYVTYKKKIGARNTVLALEMFKDQETYFVSPVSFDLRRSAATPLEYQYSLTFRAWKRVLPSNGNGQQISSYVPISRDPNKLASLLNKLNASRVVLEGARNTLTGLRGDINAALFTPLRESILFAKELLGVGLTAVDLPLSVISDLKGVITEASGVAGQLQAFGGLGNRYSEAATGLVNAGKDLAQAFQNLSISSGTAQTLSGTGLGTGQQALEDGNPAHKASANPDLNFDFYQTIRPGTLNLAPQTQKAIQAEKDRVKALKREDFEVRRDTVMATLEDFESSVGLGNATYTRVYGLSSKAKVREPNEQDYDIINAMNATLLEMNRLCVSSEINQDEVSSIDYIAGLAAGAGIAFRVPKSKFLVPFLYGHTLEQISSIYLGTPDRWHEIAALNGLQTPYVDELGFQLPLLTNGNGNNITVSDGSKLFVNQPIWIESTVMGRTKRRITAVETLSPGLVAVTVDGADDLSSYTLGASAFAQAFLPNTVNSQQSIYIPSDEAVEEDDFRLKSVPGVDQFDPLLRVGGIDLLLTQNGDLVITPDGDTRLAVGLTNITQKVRLVLDTVRGSLLHHPGYGFPSLVGESTANVDAKGLLKICQDLFKDDPTFTGVESAAILKDGPVIRITLSVGVRGTQQVIPISVEFQR